MVHILSLLVFDSLKETYTYCCTLHIPYSYITDITDETFSLMIQQIKISFIHQNLKLSFIISYKPNRVNSHLSN